MLRIPKTTKNGDHFIPAHQSSTINARRIAFNVIKLPCAASDIVLKTGIQTRKIRKIAPVVMEKAVEIMNLACNSRFFR